MREGHLHLSDRPGLGVNLLPEVLEKYEAGSEDSKQDHY